MVFNSRVYLFSKSRSQFSSYHYSILNYSSTEDGDLDLHRMDDTSLCCAFSGDREGVDELRTTLSGQLKITNDARRALAERNDIDDDEDDEEEEDDFSEEDLLAQMGYAKSDPITEEEEDEIEDSYRNEPPKHVPINPPVAELNLVSALKGSREREQGRNKACRVSWAPDVYDPPCTSDDHFTESEQKGKGVSGKKRGGGKRNRGGGSSKGNEGGSKGGGGSKEKKKGEKKHKKRGDSGSSSW